MTKVQTVSDEDLKNHDGQAQDTKKKRAPGQKQPETEESKTTDGKLLTTSLSPVVDSSSISKTLIKWLME